MTITNQLQLPDPIVRAVTNDSYNKGYCDFSTTELIAPARIRALKRRHEDELTEDASDRIWSLIGQVGHLILERAGGTDIVEERFFATFNGKRISGQVDIITAHGQDHLQDYKFTSVYAAKDGMKPEWEAQLNINRWLCEQNDQQIAAASIVAIFRDWSKGKARRERNYPQHQVQILPAPMWSMQKIEKYIVERIMAHEDAEKTLPECTPFERWAKPTTYAIKKCGNVRAINGGMHITMEAAEQHLSTLSAGHTIETRKGISIRCADYCPVSGVCDQWKKLQVEESE